MKAPRKGTDEQIISILQEHQGGVTAKEIIRRHGIALDPFYRWKRVTDATRGRGVPVARACRYLGVERSLVRYVPQRRVPEALGTRLRELATAKPRWGSPRLTWRCGTRAGR